MSGANGRRVTVEFPDKRGDLNFFDLDSLSFKFHRQLALGLQSALSILHEDRRVLRAIDGGRIESGCSGGFSSGESVTAVESMPLQ